MRKKLIRVLLIIAGLLLVLVVAFYTYFMMAFPQPGPVIHVNIPKDSASIARGKYLALHVAGCVDCHTPRKLDMFDIPYYEDSLGKGGLKFDHDLGFPGTFYTRNITPAALSSWTDDEIFHAITTGVNREGKTLFPSMPYPHYGTSDSNDVKAIIAYIRTLRPINNVVPDAKIDFPVSLLIRKAPKPAQFRAMPSVHDTIKYGEYVFNLAGCMDCHTPMDKGKPIASLTQAGGFEFHLKGVGTVRSANITPDRETGIGNWTEDAFVKRFKFYTNPEMEHKPWKEVGYQTIMPWLPYAGMTETDLRAMYQYLRSLPAISHKVEKFTPEGVTAAK